jgi:hypothetical protein
MDILSACIWLLSHTEISALVKQQKVGHWITLKAGNGIENENENGNEIWNENQNGKGSL